MREIAEEIKKWKSQNKAVAIATIVKANGSPMRPIGSKMAVTTDQQITGSVTGGCIEGAVYEEAQEVITSGKPKMLRYGVISEERPWEIGLSCGSSLTVFVESLQTPEWQQSYAPIMDVLDKNELLACVTLLDGETAGSKLLVWPDGRTQGSLGSPELDKSGQAAALIQLNTRDPKAIKLSEEVEAFIDIFIPPARLIIVGAGHIGIPLVGLAKVLGFHTIVLDPRKSYANRERFPDVDELILEWPSEAIEKLNPDQGTFIAVVSHDDKLDNPALAAALKSKAAYVGVLGTKRNVPKRLDALRELGVSEEQLTRLHAPIGLNIGAVQPEEIALSILAEIVAIHHGLERQGETHQKSII
jgi:xanthine dehydrogenase accessory factor